MEKSLNLVSIIIPTFNRANLLEESLESIIAQTYTNWECIVVDDGSIDSTMELMEFYSKNDSRVKYFRRPENYPKGANSCRNFGFEQSSGDYIQWLDDDDLISPKKLEIQIGDLIENENCESVSMSQWKFLDTNKENQLLQNEFKNQSKISIIDFYKGITKGFTFVPPNAFLTSKELVIQAGEWNLDLKINQDAEFFNRIFLKSKNIIINSDSNCYALYRFHNLERITNKKNRLSDLIFGYKLMASYLKNSKINCDFYFNWKLNELISNHKMNTIILEENRFFFKEYGISLNWYNYKNLKFSIYKVMYPIYKKTLKKKFKV